ncbi:hypothetical protein NHX12_018916 [Muraenolepis orangiensis]|uniref:Caspase-6 n=1 Tax=Muraenolepis orangiensis TaxID=630683 RepID=A0A9Q0EY30_9TELE|nr:hypothetical protein NHX12_018916 [Muraenolepis orangiensis]
MSAVPLAAEADHVQADCFVCVFLSHGEDGHVYESDGKISIKDVTALFKGDKCRRSLYFRFRDLCETLERSGQSLEFTELLTLVNMKVSQRAVMNPKDLHTVGKKQIPCFASMLTKKLYFRPKQ